MIFGPGVSREREEAMHPRRITVAAALVVLVAGSSAWALVVSDSAVTARNAVTAVLKNSVLNTLAAQYQRLERMAARLSLYTNLDKFAAPNAPSWQAYETGNFLQTLNDGGSAHASFSDVSRDRDAVNGQLDQLSGDAREVLEQHLATLDVADSSIIAAAEQIGRLRRLGEDEQRAIEQLERDVLNPSHTQSATAVLDKISGASLIEARQKDARLRYLSVLVEQLLVDSKRARDAEAAALNMQLGRLRALDRAEDGSWLRGTADDLRTWRQP
jgi:hypothetical protein